MIRHSLIASMLATSAFLLGDAIALRSSQVGLVAHARTQREDIDRWINDTSFSFPVSIAFQSTLTAPQFSDRVVFLQIEDRFCSTENLKSVFEAFAARFHESPSIRIEVFSDRKMLRRAIARYKSYPDELIFPDTPEGEEWEKKIRGDLYIPKNGWARAIYCKSQEKGEKFYYKPDADKIDMLEVVIKLPPVPEYSGNLQSDLFLACKLGDLPKAKSLIERGASVSYKDSEGQPALVYAVGQNRLEIVKLLLAQGADIDAKNRFGQTVLCEAISHGFHEISLLLIEHNADVKARYGPGISALHLASHKGAEDTVEALLAKGADPNAADRYGNTPLFDAVQCMNPRIVRMLLKSGAWVNVQNSRGETLRALANKKGDQEIIKLIGTN